MSCEYLIIRSLLISVLILLNGLLSAQTGFRDSRMKGVDMAVQEFLDDWFVPGGASVAISKNGRLVYLRGFGNVNNTSQRSVYPENKFRVASVSKPITAVAILQLIQEGKLGFDDTVFGVNGILHEYTESADQRINEITVYHLLHHLGGWGESPMFRSLQVAEEMQVSPPPGQEIFIRYMLKRNLQNDPGTSYRYSNFGYLVLGKIIERISGQTYGDFVNENIFQKIGANSFVLAVNDPDSQDIDEAHYFSNHTAASIYGDGSVVPWQYGGFDIEVMDAHGGWSSTASDLIRFATAVDGDQSRPDILSPFFRQLMVTPTSHSNYAKGWVVGNGNMWHVGSLPGTTAEVVGIGSEDVVFAIAVNYRPENNASRFNDEMDAAMWKGILSVTEWPEYDLFTDDPVPISPEDGDVISKIQLDTNREYQSVVWDGEYAWIQAKNTWHQVDKVSGLTGVSFSLSDHPDHVIKGAAWSEANQTLFLSYQHEGDQEVWEIDKNGERISSWATGLGPDQRGLAIYHDEIWIGRSGNVFSRFDLLGQRLTDVELDETIHSPMGLEWIGDDLWVVDSIDNAINIFKYDEVNLLLNLDMVVPAPYHGLFDLSFSGNDMLASGLNNNVLHLLSAGDVISAVGHTNSDVSWCNNYPNPFNSNTTIEFKVPHSAFLNLSVYNIQGQKIRDLVHEFKRAGTYTVDWDGNNNFGNKVSPGIYFCEIWSKEFAARKKMILLE